MKDHGNATPELLELLNGLTREKIKGMKVPADSNGDGTTSKNKTPETEWT